MATTNKLVDQYGRPIDRAVLSEPQTSRVASLENQYLRPMLDGLTPARLAGTLRDADNGDLIAQHRLFADMEERDAHLYAEITKRKLAILSLDWSIVPPRNASAAEQKNAEWLEEVLNDAADPIEDLFLSLMDGIGHGFAATELEWRREGSELLPAFHPRPQEWFRLDQTRRQLRLRDDSGSSPDGAELAAFGWVFHTHGKPKTGYLGRMGLHRTLVWPFLYKSYALGDFAEFLETFGLPIIVGKYFSGASQDERASLMRAVTALGHNARAIMPAEMQMEIETITGSTGQPHLTMVDWADRAQSKAILGQTMSAEAKASGLGSGNADFHREVRHDILLADARQIGGTVTRDLLYPLLALNRGGIDGLRRCPRLVFDTSEGEDLKAFADALPKLSAQRMRIPVEWAHDKLKIPMAKDGEDVLGEVSVPEPAAPAVPPAKPAPAPGAALAALAARPTAEDPTPATILANRLQSETADAWRAVLAHVEQLVSSAESLEALQATLLDAYGSLPVDDLRAVMASGLAVARLAGIADIVDEAASQQPAKAP
jgi:phage gp29-like protein